MRGPVLALLLAVVLASHVAVFMTLTDSGTFVDEIWYFRASYLIEEWIDRIAQGDASPFSADARAWNYNSEHPPVAKWVFAAADALFGPGTDLPRYGADFVQGVDRHPTAPRADLGPLGPVGGMRVGALAFLLIAQLSVFSLARREAGDAAGILAAASIVLMPRVFGHSHFACLDFPVAALMLATLALTAKVMAAERATPRLVLALAVVFGLAVGTKFSAVFILLAVAPWVLFTSFRRGVVVLATMGVVGAVVFLAVWPYLWEYTATRLANLVSFHTTHERYPAYFLGEIYDDTAAPWYYTPTILLLATPVPLLVMAAVALAWPGNRRGRGLLALAILAPMVPLFHPQIQSYDGLRHVLATPLVLAVLAGIGIVRLGNALASRVAGGAGRAGRLAARAAVPAAVCGSCLFSVLSIHPYPLAYYNVLAGGVRAGLAPPEGLGLESTVWGAEAVTPEVLEWINDNLPRRATIDWNAGAYTALREYQRYGMLRSDLRFRQGGDYWVLETNQPYWTSDLFWNLFAEGRSAQHELVTGFGPPGIDLVRVYERRRERGMSPRAGAAGR